MPFLPLMLSAGIGFVHDRLLLEMTFLAIGVTVLVIVLNRGRLTERTV